MSRVCFGVILSGLLLAAASQSLVAQPETAPPAAAETKERRSPLPDYYGKIGVSEQQRKQLDGIRDEYDAQIEALEKQIQQLEQERDAKMEAALTPGQKLRLAELRAESLKRAAEKKEAAPPPATAPAGN
jgi:hypothetical protein